jgi:hypothetical protein
VRGVFAREGDRAVTRAKRISVGTSWGEWLRGPLPALWTPKMEALRGVTDTYRNRFFAVLVAPVETRWGTVTHLMIRRHDGQMPRAWRDLQRIKNELTSPDRVAVEVYPAEGQVVDVANMAHLWVLPDGVGLPFGLHLERKGD